MPLPHSYDLEVLAAIQAHFEANAVLSAQFKWNAGNRIFRGDTGSVSPLESPKMVLLNWRTFDQVATFGSRPGGGFGGTRNLRIGIACAIYAYTEKEITQGGPLVEETAKDTVTALSGFVREVLMGLPTGGNQPWDEIEMHDPATEFDSAETYQRGVTYFYANCRVRSE